MIRPLRISKGITIIGIALFGTLSLAAQAIAKSTPINASSALKNISPEIQPLSIGDIVPDIRFDNVLNYKSKKAKLSDFKGKLVILDIWSTGCTSCIAAFPKMDELQNTFKDKLQILLVNPYRRFDPAKRIQTVLEKLKTRTGYYPTLPIPIHDTILNTYFPRESVPHLVWIDAGGKVIAITGSMDVTSENIAAILEGKEVNIPVKNDWAFDRGKPLLVDNNGGLPGDFIFRSLFTGFRGGISVGTGGRSDKNNQVIGYYLLNKSLRNLISNAYSDSMNGFQENRIILQVENPEKYKLEFDPANAYCYDLTIQPTDPKNFDHREYLKRDLKHFFNISCRKEKRILNCYIINATPSLKSSFTKYQDSEIDFDKNSINKFFHNYSIAEIIKDLGEYFDLPLVDETKISEQFIDIDFPENFDLSDREKVLQVLKKAGFDIKEGKRELEVAIITDK